MSATTAIKCENYYKHNTEYVNVVFTALCSL